VGRAIHPLVGSVGQQLGSLGYLGSLLLGLGSRAEQGRAADAD
jgi:histidine ammonia-lyase